MEMTANVFMARMVIFECGQKRQRLAHFHDDPGELVGAIVLALPRPTAGGEIRLSIPSHRTTQSDSNDVRNMAY